MSSILVSSTPQKTKPTGAPPTSGRPRLGFIGVGWIGLNRLEALAKAGAAEIAAISDPVREMTARARAIAPHAVPRSSWEQVLDMDLDGVVIATPSAQHAPQAAAALERGMAVFCQKPLGRNAAETRAVIDAARRANRLLGVDLSYRWLAGARRIREMIRREELGRIYALELAFHNAYGPDKSWFYDRSLSGGGCVIDLGIHLADLALWWLGFPEIVGTTSRLFHQGQPWSATSNAVEDYATARIDLQTGVSVQLACSWKLPAGREAVIQASVYGTKGGAALQNVNGSFYEFIAERFQGTTRVLLSSGPEAWGGGAILDWAQRLGLSREFDPEIESLRSVAEVLDAIYEAGPGKER